MPVCVFGCKWAKTEKIKHAFIHIFDSKTLNIPMGFNLK